MAEKIKLGKSKPSLRDLVIAVLDHIFWTDPEGVQEWVNMNKDALGVEVKSKTG